MNFIIRWIATAVAAAVAVVIVPGIYTVGGNATMALLIFSLVLSLINVSIKPIIQMLGAPISVLTLGIFYLIINALLLELAAWASTSLFSSGIVVTGFLSAFLGSIVISIVSALVNSFIGNDN